MNPCNRTLAERLLDPPGHERHASRPTDEHDSIDSHQLELGRLERLAADIERSVDDGEARLLQLLPRHAKRPARERAAIGAQVATGGLGIAASRQLAFEL